MSQAKLNEVGVGKSFVKVFGEDGSKNTPFLDDNDALQKRIQENRWTRWDGVEATAHEHAQWVLQQLRSWTSDERHDEFRKYGSYGGADYFIHDEETAAAAGYGFFKIQATLKVEPRDLLAIVFDLEELARNDNTVAMYKIIATYRGKKRGDPFAAVAYWSNNPGFPFWLRDGIDLTSYDRDEDGTMWQLATCLSGGDYFQSQPRAMEATDRLFGYKLVPGADGTTKVTLISQTQLNGCIPKSLSNYMVCRVLIDYMATIEKVVKARKESGDHQKMLEQLELA